MQISIFGLGRMGLQIAKRLHKNNFNVLAWNRSDNPRNEFSKFISESGVAESVSKSYADLQALVRDMSEQPRIFWLMLPQGIVDDFIFGPDYLSSQLIAGDIVIDGGNSFYKDSIRRSEELQKKGIHFFDCGTSGGVWGFDNGFALMVGGPKELWQTIEPIFKTLSSGTNYGLVGASGAGHFVKMVHNGIEYGMMESIAEGYGVMEASPFNLDFKQVTQIYREGSVIRSWLIDLTKNIFDHEDVAGTSGIIEATGEGEWTVNAGKEYGVDVRVIEDSLVIRRESKDPKNAEKFSNKLVALMRKQFGGHGITKK